MKEGGNMASKLLIVESPSKSKTIEKYLGNDYQVQPSVAGSTYGFFELRVTEPANPIFARTWKPIRGMVEIQFSPTDIVPG